MNENQYLIGKTVELNRKYLVAIVDGEIAIVGSSQAPDLAMPMIIPSNLTEGVTMMTLTAENIAQCEGKDILICEFDSVVIKQVFSPKKSP